MVRSQRQSFTHGLQPTVYDLCPNTQLKYLASMTYLRRPRGYSFQSHSTPTHRLNRLDTPGYFGS